MCCVHEAGSEQLALLRRRQAKGPDGQPIYEPCAPSERGAVEATLTQLAEKGLASQVIISSIKVAPVWGAVCPEHGGLGTHSRAADVPCGILPACEHGEQALQSSDRSCLRPLLVKLERQLKRQAVAGR